MKTTKTSDLRYGQTIILATGNMVVTAVRPAPHGHAQLLFVVGYDPATLAPRAEFIGYKARLSTR